MKTRRRLVALTATVAGLAAAGTVLAGQASAHVTVAAPGVTVGASDAAITFRVPDESDSASTVGLKVQLPTDHPIAGVLVAPITGWTATIKNTKLATPLKTDDGDISEVVSEIDWQANPGAGIKAGFFGQFTVIAGKLPDGVSSLTFKAIQTYSDGSVVSWIEQPAPGSTAQPEHPAPELALTAAAGAASSAVPAPAGSAASPAASTGASKSAATTGIVLGALALVLAAAALGLTVLRGRKGTAA
jgi:uncharacterized protein YcnI